MIKALYLLFYDRNPLSEAVVLSDFFRQRLQLRIRYRLVDPHVFRSLPACRQYCDDRSGKRQAACD